VRRGDEVKHRGIDVVAGENALGYCTDVDYPTEPFVKVVRELAASAIGIEGRKEA
jgi:hypothetical protein